MKPNVKREVIFGESISSGRLGFVRCGGYLDWLEVKECADVWVMSAPGGQVIGLIGR
jgi:hypothetical protein